MKYMYFKAARVAPLCASVLWSDVSFLLSPEIERIFLQAWKKVRLVQEGVGKYTGFQR